jgi:glycosyltransferase involved in cell wall biosynthesis
VVTLLDSWAQKVADGTNNPAAYTWPSQQATTFRDAVFLTKLIREHRPDCMIGNFGAVNLMLLLGRLYRVPSRLAWYHSMSNAIDLDNSMPFWRIVMLRIRKRLIYKSSTHIVAVTKAAQADVERVFHVPHHKCYTWYNSLRDPVEQLELACQASGNAKQRLLCVGRFDLCKGQDTLVRAAQLVKKVVPDVQVEFVGDGPRRTSCMRLACDLGVSENCHFAGRMPHDEVLKRIGAATATIVPSRAEAFGLVNIESMAMGTPIVASAVGGIIELFEDGEEGFLVPPDEPVILADRITRLLLNPQLRDAMARKARQRFLRFEQSSVVREQANWLEEIAARG